MKFSFALATAVAVSLVAFGADAATIAKKHHAHKTSTPAATDPAAASPEAAPAEAGPPKVVEPDPIQFGHAGAGTKY